MSDPKPNCYFDVTVNNQPLGRIEFKLYDDVTPRTCENFRELCLRAKGQGYKGSKFHRIIPEFMIQASLTTPRDKSSLLFFSIESNPILSIDLREVTSLLEMVLVEFPSSEPSKFNDENFNLKHTKPGLLSMANAGPNTNGSQFFITTEVTDWLNGKHVVFGEVVKGYNEVVKAMEAKGSKSGPPSATIMIADCGTL
ncbi:hypothetical protein PSTT_10313 [Puccinia striiformis]|uniref:Peptidyl-prolyl cis-trans isomerase n=1 Tax=Puccinia striiformis TaxID=27350 RepID=A0A2S4V524_9BASI|nr:hypothetical protein PSTT_10313 [Puccinia striiformis]